MNNQHRLIAAADVAKAARSFGLTVTSFEEGDEQLDGEVCFGPNLHIQVPSLHAGGLSLVQVNHPDTDDMENVYLIWEGSLNEVLLTAKRYLEGTYKPVNKVVNFGDGTLYIDSVTQMKRGFSVKAVNYTGNRVGKITHRILVHDAEDFAKAGYGKFLDACFSQKASYERKMRREGKVIGNIYVG